MHQRRSVGSPCLLHHVFAPKEVSWIPLLGTSLFLNARDMKQEVEKSEICQSTLNPGPRIPSWAFPAVGRLWPSSNKHFYLAQIWERQNHFQGEWLTLLFNLPLIAYHVHRFLSFSYLTSSSSTGCIFNGPPLFRTKMKQFNERTRGSLEGFHRAASLIGSLAFFILVLNRGGASKKITLNCS